jgi:endonuclease/exonuclease/phosphatase (EEP) superfamily protein YafD
MEEAMSERFRFGFSALAVFVGCAASDQPVANPPAEEPTLRVLTYNVNYGLASDADTLGAIGVADADVVVLQETTPEWEVAIRERLSASYPQMLFHHSRGAGGLAVLARFPVHSREVIDAPSGWFPAWRLVVDGPLGPVQLLAVHLRPPVSESGSVVSGYFTTQPIREQEISAYLERLEPGLPTIIAGDFNERDGRAMEVLRQHGFRSSVSELHGRHPTWRWQTSLGQVRAQLDHVVHDELLLPRRAEIIDAGRSDHLPVLVELVRADRAPRTMDP